MLEILRESLFQLFILLIITFLVSFCVQKFINVIIACTILLFRTRIKNFSFGYAFGTSTFNIHLKTNSFDLWIGKITLKPAWKLTINVTDIILVLNSSAQEVKSPSADETPLNFTPVSQASSSTESFIFSLKRRYIPIIRFLLSFNTLLKSVNIVLPNGSHVRLKLCSAYVVKKSKQLVNIDILAHEVSYECLNAHIGFIGYHLNVGLATNDINSSDTVEVILERWDSSLKIGDIAVSADDNLTDALDDSLSEQEIVSQTETIESTSNNLKRLVKSISYLLRTLNILDVKIENVKLSFKKAAVMNISSIQVYLEAVNVVNNGTSLDTLPPNRQMWGNYELSISACSVVIKSYDCSTLRIPLINIITTTNIIMHFAEEVPLSKTTLSVTTNIINPSVYTTVDQLNKFIEFVGEIRKKRRRRGNNGKECSKYTSGNSSAPNLLTVYSEDVPSITFEASMANFTSTIQVTKTENITFKLFSMQAMIVALNEGGSSPINTPYSEEEWTDIFRSASQSSSSDYIKIVGADISYLKFEDNMLSMPVSIPIFRFERIDAFLEEFTTTKAKIQCTLRHIVLGLHDVVVLDKLCSAFGSVRNSILAHQNSMGEDECVSSSDTGVPQMEWTIKLRVKDISVSAIFANYIPQALDPGLLNLTQRERGVRLTLSESLLEFDKRGLAFTIKQITLFRVMDNEDYECAADSVFQLSDVSIKLDDEKKILLSWPSSRVKFDINLVWLFFYLKNICLRYLPKALAAKSANKKSTKSLGKSWSLSAIHSVVKIGKLLIHVTLPHDIPVLLVLGNIQYSPEDFALSSNSVRMLTQSVYVKERIFYSTLMEIRDVRLNLKDALKSHIISITTSTIDFRTEYQYKFYLILDNVVNAYKSFKQIRAAFSNLNQFERVYPNAQSPLKIPQVRLLSDSLAIGIEEDPFEQELGLIFKIGILEQRERLEKLRQLDARLEKMKYEVQNVINDYEKENDPFEEFKNKIVDTLYINFSESWISRYRRAKLTFGVMPPSIERHYEAGFGYISLIRRKTTTVANLVVKGLDMSIHPPSFPLEQYHDFLNKFGKSVPKDFSYTLLLMMGINIKTGLWELRLRDYPIPVLSFPDTHTTGDIVFAEKMPKEYGTHSVYIPFVPSAKRDGYLNSNCIYGSHIIRTMNTVKTYFNIKTFVKHPRPTYITWGKSLQPGFEAFMLWFDYLTKPKLDPSPKLGFWDKFRYLFHGSWTYEFSERSDLHLNIKGSNNPYKILDDGAGLTFCWSGKTVVRIHENGDPIQFLKINSERFMLGVRDFTVPDRFDKVFMRLEGRVCWTLGLLFEWGDLQDPGSTKRIAPVKPHYEVNLVNPIDVMNIPSYDSYKGFRSNFIHMSFGVYSYEGRSSNNLYVGPTSLDHFLTWWQLFGTFTSGPIRQGPLFSSLIQNSMKFTRSLFSFKYQLHLEPLVFSNVYKHLAPQYLSGASSKMSFTGLKGRVECLKIDLHQKRIKLIHRDEILDRTKPVWKFRISTGEIDCSEVDVRTLSAVFDDMTVKSIIPTPLNENQSYYQSGISLLKESEWYDSEDYVDLGDLEAKSNVPLKFDALPLFYTPRISYFRRLGDEGNPVDYPFGDEPSHVCLIGKSYPERTQQVLAHRRKAEIEQQIDHVNLSLKNLQSHLGHASSGDKTVKKLKDDLRRLHYGLHIIKIILSDLYISDGVSGDASSSELVGETDVGILDDSSYNSELAVFKTKTLDSFISMKRASTIQVQTSFDNRFMVQNIQLKIDKKIRDTLLEYAANILERRTLKFSMTYKSVTILKDLIGNVMQTVQTGLDDMYSFSDEERFSNVDFIKNFEELIRTVPDDTRFKSIDNYSFRLISPQIQIRSEIEPNTALIMSARDVEVEIIDIVQFIGKSGKRIAVDIDRIIETRYCAITKDLQLFTLYKDTLISSEIRLFQKNGYGIDKWSDYWPPWLPLEVCFDDSPLEKYVFLKRRSVFMVFNSPNPLFFGENNTLTSSNESMLRIGFPSLNVTSSSTQYCSVYAIIQDLLSFKSNLDNKIEKLTRVLLADEVRNNLSKLDVKVVTNLQRKVKDFHYTQMFLREYKPKLYQKTAQDLAYEMLTNVLRLTILMTAIKKNYDSLSKNGPSARKFTWKVSTDELIWELYDEEKRPFVTVSLGPSIYTRTEKSDGINSNKVNISSLQCLNQQDNPVYVQLLAPYVNHSSYNDSIPMLEIFWIQSPPVGGISNLDELLITFQPLIFRMDNETLHELIEYLFPKVYPGANTEIFRSRKMDQSGLAVLLSGTEAVDTAPFDEVSTKDFLKKIDSWDLTSLKTKSRNSKAGDDFQRVEVLSKSMFGGHDQNLDAMVERSGTFFHLKLLRINRTLTVVSYKGSHRLLTDVNDLTVKVPTLEYHHKLWSRDELFSSIKHDITKIVLQNLGSIIGNKFLPHKGEHARQPPHPSTNHHVNPTVVALDNTRGFGSGVDTLPSLQGEQTSENVREEGHEGDNDRFSEVNDVESFFPVAD